MSRFLMRDENGETCSRCGGTGMVRNLATMSPSDAEPCPCTYEDDEHEADSEPTPADDDPRDQFRSGTHRWRG